MNMWRVGEDMGSKEMDRCPLTDIGHFKVELCKRFDISDLGELTWL
jgi:hypothetical protein